MKIEIQLSQLDRFCSIFIRGGESRFMIYCVKTQSAVSKEIRPIATQYRAGSRSDRMLALKYHSASLTNS